VIVNSVQVGQFVVKACAVPLKVPLKISAPTGRLAGTVTVAGMLRVSVSF
jgi:hypothetical protein